MKIYHNPRCTKSRETLALKKLSIPAEKLIRKSEAIYKEHFKGKDLSEAKWIDAMAKYPKLIERPIVIKGNKAIIGRPPQNVEKLF